MGITGIPNEAYQDGTLLNQKQFCVVNVVQAVLPTLTQMRDGVRWVIGEIEEQNGDYLLVADMQ